MSTTLTGTEQFTFRGTGSGLSVSDFWAWAFSDLLDNTQRGILAEFIVFSALGMTPHPIARDNWMPYDIVSPSGRRIEVKSAAYLQSWTQDYHSQILFDIAPKYSWSPEIGYSTERRRNSELYVFCVYTALSRDESILNLDLWDFYMLPTSILNKEKQEQKKIGLQSLLKLGPIKTDYATLGATIESIEL